MYDVIVVGARTAGASTALLLAREGCRVLLVDRAALPSDSPTGHYIHQPGVATLKRWGLLDRVIASNCPPVTRIVFDTGSFTLSGSPPPAPGDVAAAYAPRQIVLSRILSEAAVAAGVELRDRFTVEDVTVEHGRVTGIRGHAGDGTTVTERARLVVGADGRNSRVARLVQAPSYNERPSLTGAWWSYWSDVPASGFEIFLRPRRGLGLIPTNDGRTLVFTTVPAAETAAFRADIEGNFARDLALIPALAERVHAGRREEPFYGAIDLPNRFRRPYGPGWVLAGDAGYHKDPCTAQGITDAFRDAELLTRALVRGFFGELPLDQALAGFEQARNAAVEPIYDLTCRIATLDLPPELQQLLAALQHNQTETDYFMGTLAGTVPVPTFFAPEHTRQLVAAR